MKKAIIICDNDINSLENYEIVFSLGKLIELELKSAGIDSINIYDIKIPFQNNNIQSDIEKFLELEHKISGKQNGLMLLFSMFYGDTFIIISLKKDLII